MNTPRALMLLLLVACSSTQTLDEGFAVEVRAQLYERASVAEDGAAHALSGVKLVLSSATLKPCPQSAWLRLMHAVWPIAEAHAHEMSDPLHIGSPHVLDASGEVRLGTFTPPPGDYCALVLVVAPADADAHGVEDAPDMVGHTSSLGIDAGTPMRFAGRAEALLSLERMSLRSDASERAHVIEVAVDTSSWLQSIDPNQVDASQLIDNIAQSLALE